MTSFSWPAAILVAYLAFVVFYFVGIRRHRR
jgi:hypothetical protein